MLIQNAETLKQHYEMLKQIAETLKVGFHLN